MSSNSMPTKNKIAKLSKLETQVNKLLSGEYQYHISQIISIDNNITKQKLLDMLYEISDDVVHVELDVNENWNTVDIDFKRLATAAETQKYIDELQLEITNIKKSIS